MALCILIATGCFLFILQTTILQLLPDWAGEPDFVFILLVFAAIRLQITQGILVVLFFGLVMDIFSGIYLGVISAVYLFTFVLLRIFSQTFALDYLAHQPIITALCYLFAMSGIFIFSKLLAIDSYLYWSWQQVLLGSLMVAVFAIPFQQLFAFIMTLQPINSRRSRRLRRTGNGFS